MSLCEDEEGEQGKGEKRDFACVPERERERERETERERNRERERTQDESLDGEDDLEEVGPRTPHLHPFACTANEQLKPISLSLSLSLSVSPLLPFPLHLLSPFPSIFSLSSSLSSSLTFPGTQEA